VHPADVFDVLVHERPYREPFTVDRAILELREGAGTQFEPDVVRAFEDLGALAWSPPAEDDARQGQLTATALAAVDDALRLHLASGWRYLTGPREEGEARGGV
jgi:hypothetical protein